MASNLKRRALAPGARRRGALRRAGGPRRRARRRTSSSPSPRPPPPSSRACSSTCCRRSSKDTGIDVHVVARGHRPGARHGAARRRRRGVRARQGRRGEIPRRGLGREALRGHVQRFRARRAEVGPRAQVKGQATSSQALQRIEPAKAPFVSRGDKSGTNAAELRSWKAAGIDLAKEKGPWYKETRLGHGPDAQHRLGAWTPTRSPIAARGYRSRTAATS